MAGNKVKPTIEVVNLPSGEFTKDFFEYCIEYENNLYIPGEKLPVEELTDSSQLKCIEAEILEKSDEDGKHKLCLTVKVFELEKNSIKQLLDSWLLENDIDIKYLSHEVINSTSSFHIVHVTCLAGYCDIQDFFDAPIESPFVKDVWDKYMQRIITEGVCYIHGNVSVLLRDSLRKNLDYLAETSHIDYHPNSNDIVRDLVHPALYSFVKGVSKLKHGHEAQTKTDASEAEDYWGREYEDSKYQWLPTPFSISSDGKCTITDYINNLEQNKYSSLYDDLTNLFELFLPYFEEVWSYVKSITFFRGEDFPGQSDAVGLDTDDFCVDASYDPGPKIKENLQGCELQVIVKIVDYTLQPGQAYEGVWHAEGMSHEHIVMTGIYFLDRDIDITGGDLRFKRGYELGERNQVHFSVPQCRPITIDGIASEGFVPLGYFPTEEGYLLVFPNCHIHKISKLINESQSKSSSRRVVVFFVVDPERTIISTRDVAPQQDEISLEQAKLYRLELMSERKYNKDKLNIRDIELCEH